MNPTDPKHFIIDFVDFDPYTVVASGFVSIDGGATYLVYNGDFNRSHFEVVALIPASRVRCILEKSAFKAD